MRITSNNRHLASGRWIRGKVGSTQLKKILVVLSLAILGLV